VVCTPSVLWQEDPASTLFAPLSPLKKGELYLDTNYPQTKKILKKGE